MGCAIASNACNPKGSRGQQPKANEADVIIHTSACSLVPVEPSIAVASANSSMLAVLAICSCNEWVTFLFTPWQMAQVSRVAEPFRTTIAAWCVQELRRPQIYVMSPSESGEIGKRALQRLHRATRLATHVTAMAHPTIVAAENYSVGVDVRGRLYLWGRPGWLAQGVVANASPPLPPTAAEICGQLAVSKPRIASVATSRYAVFALTEDGEMLFTQVRRDSNLGVSEVILKPLCELGGVHIVQIASRFGQVFAVTSDGEVYAWGMASGDPSHRNHRCSMGFGKIATELQPSRIPCFGRGEISVRSVACGISHTVFVTSFGRAYAVGRNDHGKLGLGNCTKAVWPTKLNFESQLCPFIVAAAAGAKHTLLLTNSGHVWGCGAADNGALPTSASALSHVSSPVLCDKLQCFCISLAAGISMSLFVCERGEVYMTGRSSWTETPFSRCARYRAALCEPVQIRGLSQIEQVSISMELSMFQWEHALFACQDGRIFGWGHTGNGELCPGALSCSNGRRKVPDRFCNEVVEMQRFLVLTAHERRLSHFKSFGSHASI